MSHLRRWVTLLALAGVLAGCGGAPAVSTTATVAPPTAVAATAAPIVEPTSEPPTATAPEATTAPAASTPEPTLAPAATEATEMSDEQILASLQETVDVWSEAFSTNQPELIEKIVDRKSPALKRTQQALIKYYYEGIGGSGLDWTAKVSDIIRRENGYLQAYVDRGDSRYTFTFKQNGTSWLMAEPTRAELGKREKIETEHFTVQYYPWDAGIAQKIADLMEAAHTTVVDKMGKGPEKKSLVQLIPTNEVMPGGAKGTTLAFYRRASGARVGLQEMVINSPSSYGFGSFPIDTGWETDLGTTLAHEYTHLVNDCCFTPIARQNSWMTEGLAEYISDGPISRAGQVALAVQQDAIIPLQDKTSGRVYKQDLEHLTLLDKDISLAYGLSSSLVDYIVRNYGGMEGYWKLIGDYDKTQDFNQSLQNVLNITLEDFENGWHAELKQKFGG